MAGAHVAAIVFLFLIFYPYSLDFFDHAASIRGLVVNVLLLQAWSSNMATYWSYNAPSWSVSCELFFYAVFPLAVVLLSRQTLMRLVMILAVIFCGIFLVGRAYPGLDANWLGSVNPLSCFAAFAIGIGVGIWRKKLPAPRLTFTGGTVVQCVALALALGANAFFAAHVLSSVAGATTFLVAFGASPFYAAFLLALARYDGALSRGLSYPSIVYGGEISYSIYLFHQLFIRWHSGYLSFFSPVPIWLQYAGIIIATLITAAAVHGLIEGPARRRMLAGWRALKRPVQVSGGVVPDPMIATEPGPSSPRAPVGRAGSR